MAKKYPSLKIEFAELLTSVENEPEQGTPIGNHCFKIRLAMTSKGKGKRGGSRLISHFVLSHRTVYLLTIYDKSDQVTLRDYELKDLLKFIQD